MKYQNIGGVATLVQHRGATTLPGHPPDCGLGSVVVCLHDAGGNGNGFADLMDALAATQSPIAFDLPGHGRSGGLDALDSIGAMAAHAAGLLDAFGIGSVALVGEGMGGAVAIELALARPDLASALVLVGGPAISFAFDTEIASLSAITSGRARREFDRSGYAPDTDRAVYQKAFAEWVKTDPRATLGDRKAQAAWTLGSRGEAISAPVLVVVGEHEEAASVAAATELVAQLGSASIDTLSGAGRRGGVEQPAALAARIASFLEGARGQRSRETPP
ncbi:MAG: alpha/beta hydrolase, partial [Actinomycetota bacterium]|nr:alpha/beta hydrolase [Actinomycetota bacterium]